MQGEACKPYKESIQRSNYKLKKSKDNKLFLTYFTSCECNAQQNESTAEHARMTLTTHGASHRGEYNPYALFGTS